MKLKVERGPVPATVSVQFPVLLWAPGHEERCWTLVLEGLPLLILCFPLSSGWGHGQVTFPGLGQLVWVGRGSRFLETP